MKIIKKQNITIAAIDAQNKLEKTSQLLDIFATVSYDEQADNIGLVVQKGSLPKAFLDLKSGIAGEMLQKFSNYGVKLAIVGDFDNISSDSLAAFIRECNRGRHIFFVQNEDEALQRLEA